MNGNARHTHMTPLAWALCLAVAITCLVIAPARAFADTLDLGVTLGSGYTVEVDGVPVNQKDIKAPALKAVTDWRRDALNDTRVLWDGVTMRQYLSDHGISEADYLNPKWSNEAERICVQRAFECNINWDHIRPNGDSCFTAQYGTGFDSGEVIARGSDYITGAIGMWASEKSAYVNNTGGVTGHYTFLIDPYSTSYGFSVINGCSVGHCYQNSTDSSELNVSGTFTMRLNVPGDMIAYYGTVANLATVRIGQTKQAQVYIADGSGMFRLVCTWSSSDPSIVSATSDGLLTGVSAGTCDIMITCTDQYGNTGGTTFSVMSGVDAMYRLYNPNSGEHFYTANEEERDNVIAAGWNYEGIGWYAPESSNTPVYRLYNPYAGDHHYTTDVEERDMLKRVGWRDEGTGWYSDDAHAVPLYRQYNPNQFACNHNYTTDKDENDYLVSLGWRAEGIGWYGV